MHHPIFQRLKAEIEAREQAGLGRSLMAVSERHGTTVTVDGREYLNFSSNDFLGLAQDRDMAGKLADLCRRFGSGSGASRLVTGTENSTLAAEQALADYFGYESCLIMGSGFLANLTLIATLFSEKDTLLLDKRAHTSTMAGVWHSRARFHTFRHNRMSHLRKLLEAHPPEAVLTESLFSMDGDSPDFAALKKLKEEFNFLCIVDEAHALGVLGSEGKGLGRDVADVTVGTLGKAFGMFGAFILGPQIVRDYLIHEQAARHKGMKDPLAGKADILLAPDLAAGNIFYKSLMYFARARSAGVVVGTKAPVLLNSRADSHETKINAVALGILMAAGGSGQ